MKRTVLNLAIAAFMAGTMITSCQSSADKVENAQDKVEAAEENVEVARQELDQALRDSIQQFRLESEKELIANEKIIADFKVKIARDRLENRAEYERNLAALEQKNREMRRDLEEFNEVQRDKWDSFRFKLKQDMDEHAKAIRDFWRGKK